MIIKSLKEVGLEKRMARCLIPFSRMECFLTRNDLKKKGIQRSPDQRESTTAIKPKCQQQNKSLLRKKKKNHGEQSQGNIVTEERYFRYFTLTLHIWTNTLKFSRTKWKCLLYPFCCGQSGLGLGLPVGEGRGEGPTDTGGVRWKKVTWVKTMKTNRISEDKDSRGGEEGHRALKN